MHKKILSLVFSVVTFCELGGLNAMAAEHSGSQPFQQARVCGHSLTSVIQYLLGEGCVLVDLQLRPIGSTATMECGDIDVTLVDGLFLCVNATFE